MFPDELIFLGIITREAANGEFFPRNYLGYGSGWWAIAKFIWWSLGSPVVPMLDPATYFGPTQHDSLYFSLLAIRAVSVASLFGSMVFIVLREQNINRRIFLCMVFALPIFWWNGKLASPDFIAVAAGTLSINLWRRSPIPSGLFIGIASAIRITNAFLFSGIILMEIFYLLKARDFNTAFNYCFAVLIGILIGNPYLAIDFPQAISLIKGVPGTNQISPEILWNTFKIIVSGNSLEWDLPSTGSFEYWSGSFLLFLAAVVVLFKAKQTPFIVATMFGVLLLTVAVSLRGLGYGWYFMPIIPGLYIYSCKFGELGRSKYSVLLVFLIVAGTAISVYRSYYELRQVWDRSVVLGLDKDIQCATDFLAGSKGRTIIILDPSSNKPVMPSGYNYIYTHMFLLVREKGDGFDPAKDNLIMSTNYASKLPWADEIMQKAELNRSVRTCGMSIFASKATE